MPVLSSNAVLADLLDGHADRLARTESLSLETIRQGLEQGTMVLLANPAHQGVEPILVGRPSGIKVNANLGTSPLIADADQELKKLDVARAAGADTVMDLSTGGDLDAIRRAMIKATPLPLGTVPLYAATARRIAKGQDPASFSADELLEEIVRQAEQGVDFMTVHCGVTARAAALAEESGRVMGVVSRGGAIMIRHMARHKVENPLLTRYDELLGIALAHNVTLSLGDGMRPGAGADAGDPAQWEEVTVLAELTRRAWERGVQVMIEGPGHVPLDQVEAQIKGIKRMTMGAPLYVLGPLTTDAAPGHDHIAGAIGGALAAWHGADFLCYLTPAEHLTLPGGEDVYQGVIASRIAARSAEVALGRPAAVQGDLAMSEARAALDWTAMAGAALDPPAVRHRRKDFQEREECAMCGEFCAVKMLRDMER